MTDVRSPFVKLGRLARTPSGQPGGTMPTTVEGGYGRVPAATVQPDAPTPTAKPLSPKDAERLIQAEILSAATQLRESTTALTATLGGRSGAVNGVLLVRLVVLDADGQWSYSSPVAVGSVTVENHHPTGAALVQSGVSGGGSLAGVATGAQLVPAGQLRKVPIGAHGFTILGTPGAQCSVQAFDGLQPYGVR